MFRHKWRNAAKNALADFGLSIPVCGMVKDDRHKSRALLFNGEELELGARSEAFKLITRIQDEAHRFAVEYHRKLRDRSALSSVLDDIPGIGEKRRKALLREFGDIEVIKGRSEEELAAVPGMDKRSAGAVYKFFNP